MSGEYNVCPNCGHYPTVQIKIGQILNRKKKITSPDIYQCNWCNKQYKIQTDFDILNR